MQVVWGGVVGIVDPRSSIQGRRLFCNHLGCRQQQSAASGARNLPRGTEVAHHTVLVGLVCNLVIINNINITYPSLPAHKQSPIQVLTGPSVD